MRTLYHASDTIKYDSEDMTPKCEDDVDLLHLQHMGRGSIMNYVMSVESSLGSLAFMRIWHDNSGKGKQQSWYLDQVQITDLQTGEKSVLLTQILLLIWYVISL